MIAQDEKGGSLTTTPIAPRRALIHLKWTLHDALAQGATPAELCRQLGKPWTPELLTQAFPDVIRRVAA